MSINIGMTEQQRQTIAQGLAKVLADTYTLYLKTHNYHWNVRGPMFHSLHTMFETQFAKLASIPQGDNRKDAQAMVRDLVEGQEAVVRTCRALFPAVDEANDEPTADLLTTRMQTHEKNAWMLRSLLEN